MTPSAITPAGRAATKPVDALHHRRPPAGTARKPDLAQPRALRRTPAAPVPRRLSGPLGGLARAPRGSVQPSGGSPALSGRSAPLGVRAAAIARALAGHALLDRIVRGRAWIPLLGVMLAGIVAMQVEVLKLGASMGRSIERTTALQSRNGMLRASVASLSDEQRIERLAAGAGMLMPAPEAVAFLSARPDASAHQGVAGIHAPDPSGFTARLPSSAATAGSATTATATPGSAITTTATAGSATTASGATGG